MSISIQLGDQTEWQQEQKEYLRYQYPLNHNHVAIDIGAYKGDWAIRMNEKYKCNVIAFEPTEAIEIIKNYALQKWRVGSSAAGPTRGIITPVEAAAWVYNGTLPLGGEHFWISMFYQDRVKIFNCIDIADYLKGVLEEYKYIGVCKINIEGGEYQLLRHLINNDLHWQIKYFQIQFHLIDGQDSQKEYAEIAGMLGNTHRLQWRYPFVWESWISKHL